MEPALIERRVSAALRGELALSALSRDEGDAFNVAVADALRDRLAKSNYGNILATRGLASIAGSEDGRLTKFLSDGTTRYLP